MRVLWAGFSDDRVEWELIRALVAAGVGGHAIAAPGSRIARGCAASGIPCLEARFPPRLDPRGARLIRAVLEQKRFDIVHCVTGRALAAALRATARSGSSTPRVVAYRGAIGTESRRDPLLRLSYLHPRVARIICVCEAVRRQWRASGVPEEKLVVIRKGHDPAWYSPAPRETLASLGVPADAVRVVFCGAIRPIKGVSVLVRAFERIAPEEGLCLVLLGEVREAGVKRRAQRLPHAHLLGFRKDAPALVGSCDIAVMPSVYREGWPKAVLEAMAQGVPPIVTDTGGLPEAVEHEKSGLVVPANDADALGEALRRLARDVALRRRLGEAARARVAGPLHFRHTVEETLALYRELVGEASAAEGRVRRARRRRAGTAMRGHAARAVNAQESALSRPCLAAEQAGFQALERHRRFISKAWKLADAPPSGLEDAACLGRVKCAPGIWKRP
jgi:glycosyltransferase involved in cell wall biosynthesis